MTNDEKDALLAIKENNVEHYKFLLDNKKVPIDFYDDNGWSSLIMAVEFDRKEIISLLLSYGANAGIKDMKEYSILETILILNYVEISQYLIENGADYKNIRWEIIPEKMRTPTKKYISIFEEKKNLESKLNTPVSNKKLSKL